MHLYGIFILGKLYASLLFPFLLLQLFSGEWVAVVVSGQQAEVAIFLRVKVEPRQLWQQNRWFSTTARYLVSVLLDTVDRHLLLTWRTTGGLRGGRGRCGGRGGRGWHDWRRRRWWWWGRGLVFTSPLRSPLWRSSISVSIPGDRSRRNEQWQANHVADN